MDIVERLRAYQHWDQPEEDKDLHKKAIAEVEKLRGIIKQQLLYHKTAIAEMEKLRDIITHFKMEKSDGT